MKVDKSKLKVTGMLAAVIAVVGITVVIANSSVVDLTRGVSADLGDLATGSVTVMSTEDYDLVLDKLTEYFDIATDQTLQDNLVAEVVNILQDVQK
ncbi:hypothetical protein JXA59_02315 [Patescibacteria group bacterium]|nr:hypothetical protein [Patescibacteria group bacterium]